MSRVDRLVRAHELFFLLVARERRRRPVRPAVMADLVAGVGDALHGVGIGLERVARDVPGARNVVALQQLEDARHADVQARTRRARSGPGEVMPRAIQPEIASKSKVRQTIDVTWRACAA